ncbi:MULTISPECIES: sodium:solute symporter family transporter [Mediterranea]|uniref:sodium:solute symporter family transporter n=2 Tax=Bacteroidaceae TaxID=815 RepID=UPI0020124014|nr:MULTISPECIES: sodium/solute symporter [Mediterranea]MCL1607467.1 sodium/solute symporter [Mediterranea sp. ET5]MDM8122354.1 sodium/solute symporter [Mediterranea massiliensis]MDM8198793.1 sodium/solute symporter [Mediterranea massiliensis]
MEILEALKNNGFATADYLVFAAYIVLLVGLGIFLSRGKKGEEKSSSDYFLAGNTLTWWAVGASLIAANISAEQFIGMSGSAFKSGIAMAAYELMAAATLIVVAKFLLPVMIKRKIFTIPQFLSERYNWGVGLAFSIFWLFLYVFINLTSVAWLGALAIKQILGLPATPAVLLGMQVDMTLLVIILLLFLIAGAYSIYGGLASVAWTDVMQVTFLVGGGLVTAYAALDVISTKLELNGALDALSYIMGHLSSIPGDTHFNLVVERNADLYPVLEGTATQPSDPYFDIPGITVIVGALWLTNLGYWGFNQYIIQKGLAAKSLAEAKKGMIFAAFLKILIPFIVCIPGVCAFYIVNYQPELTQTLAGAIERSDDAYPFLIRNFTPTVVKGLSFAALAAAVISSLASMFNSTSTIFTMDIYKKFINKTASEKKLVNVGRLTSLASLVIALLAVYPIMGGADQAFQIIQEYSGFVYPGVVVIFGLGLLWKRASGVAAVVTAIGTFVFSIAFKFMMPGTPFLLRMGYVFMVLVVLFFTLSYMSNKTVKAEQLDAHTTKTQLFWGNVMLVLAIICFLIGCIVFFSDITLLKNYGFEAIFFLGTFFLSLWIYLRSNALDTVQDGKAVAIDLSLFRSDRSFTIGSALVVIILAILYIALW